MRKKFSLISGLAALSLLATGCLGGGSTPEASEDGGEETAKETIQIMYAFSGDQSTAFQADMDAWGEENGITFDWIQSNEFEVQISSKVQSGNAPDIAIFPQPGILKAMAEEGELAELSTQVDLDKLEADIIPGFLDAATVDDVVYGAPMAMNGKSFYWYNKPAFEAAGYAVPETHDDLLALLEQIKADGVAPLCYGMESGSATGCLGGGSTPEASEDVGEETAKETIQIMYAFSGDQSTAFQSDMDTWGEANGITFDWIQSNEFEVQINSKVQSGNAPDIAIFPQPGILKALAEEGELAELSTQVDLDQLEADIIPGFLDAATVDDVVYGAPMAMNAKSFYWYNKPAFEEAGYTVPETHDDLLALLDQIKADGVAPCATEWSPDRPPDGPPPTGSRTTSCRPAASTSTTSG